LYGFDNAVDKKDYVTARKHLRVLVRRILTMGTAKNQYSVKAADLYSDAVILIKRAISLGMEDVLIEDIDCRFEPHITSREGGGNACTNQSEDPTGPDDGNDQMTLSDFLNAIDGVTSQKDGRILIITTNHHDKLDPAITRPGRIDAKVEFKHADLYQLNLLSQRMLGEKDGIAYFKKHFKNRKIPITMAEAENILLPIALAQIENR
jgi:chaperone BCS1